VDINLTLEEVNKLAEFLEKPVEYVAVWKDYFYPTTEHNGQLFKLPNADRALEVAKSEAEKHGFSGITYFVKAVIGGVIVPRIKGYEGTT
jgi:hypothetical protein